MTERQVSDYGSLAWLGGERNRKDEGAEPGRADQEAPMSNLDAGGLVDSQPLQSLHPFCCVLKQLPRRSTNALTKSLQLCILTHPATIFGKNEVCSLREHEVQWFHNHKCCLGHFATISPPGSLEDCTLVSHACPNCLVSGFPVW